MHTSRQPKHQQIRNQCDTNQCCSSLSILSFYFPFAFLSHFPFSIFGCNIPYQNRRNFGMLNRRYRLMFTQTWTNINNARKWILCRWRYLFHAVFIPTSAVLCVNRRKYLSRAEKQSQNQVLRRWIADRKSQEWALFVNTNPSRRCLCACAQSTACRQAFQIKISSSNESTKRKNRSTTERVSGASDPCLNRQCNFDQWDQATHERKATNRFDMNRIPFLSDYDHLMQTGIIN